MTHSLKVRPLGWLARLGDRLMIPVMYLISGVLSEVPQRTHRWNNTKLRREDLTWLNPAGIVTGKRVGAYRWHEKLVFHMPILGGWKKYVVLRPRNPIGSWHVGWRSSIHCGVSRIPLTGDVRVLLGPDNVEFFGIDATTGVQRALQRVGNGEIGDGGRFAQLPLL